MRNSRVAVAFLENREKRDMWKSEQAHVWTKGRMAGKWAKILTCRKGSITTGRCQVSTGGP